MIDIGVANTVINQMSSLLTISFLDEKLSLPLKDLDSWDSFITHPSLLNSGELEDHNCLHRWIIMLLWLSNCFYQKFSRKILSMSMGMIIWFNLPKRPLERKMFVIWFEQ